MEASYGGSNCQGSCATVKAGQWGKLTPSRIRSKQMHILPRITTACYTKYPELKHVLCSRVISSTCLPEIAPKLALQFR